MIVKISKGKIKQLVTCVNDISEKYQDEMAIPSYLHKNPLITWLMWKRYEYIALLAELNKNKTVLEFGCGVGVFLPTLSQNTGKVYAIDLFPQYAKKLVEDMKMDITFINSLDDLKDESLDVIIAADVMEHLDNPAKFAQTFRSKLKSGGSLIISGPTENLIYKIGRVAAGFGGKGDYHHTNIDSLRKVIENSGFKLIKQRTLPFRIPPYLFRIFKFKK
jgi:2-polyprenyl-3-methyl-5-hydroxy-6-metoxy-1,4-benzoquinol methylase